MTPEQRWKASNLLTDHNRGDIFIPREIRNLLHQMIMDWDAKEELDEQERSAKNTR
jgi:hypothetical protein